MVLVSVALVRVMYVPGFVAMVLVRVALMRVVAVVLGVVLVPVALVSVVDVPGLVTVVLMSVALMRVMGVCHSICLLSFFSSMPTPGLSGGPAEAMRYKISYVSQ